MKVIIDSNIIIDVLEKREPHFQKSYEVVQLSMSKHIEGYVCAGCMTDIHYIIRKNVASDSIAKDAMIHLEELVGVCDTLASDITASHVLDMNDYEDAVLAATAKREKADYIVTRNKRDFVNSPVPAVAPEELLALCGKQ
ncbi:MAG: PIN domain-containing protein [Oscillospiraceae bacterium]|nr:PIN domain-containing protein [Oscillospiraceae bacterium]